MARPRLPSGFAIALTILHALSLLACILAIGASAYSAATHSKTAIGTIGTFVAAFWTIGVDIAEVAALADKARKRIKRCPIKFLWLLELTTAIFCFGLSAASMLGYDAAEYERCRYVKHADREAMGCERNAAGDMDVGWMAAMGGIYLAATIHSILFVMTLVQFCVVKRKARRAGVEVKNGPGLPAPEAEKVLAPPPMAAVRN